MLRTLLSVLLIIFNISLFAQPKGMSVEALKYEHAAWQSIIDAISNRDLLKSKDRFFNAMPGYLPPKRDLGFGCDRYKFHKGNFEWITVVVFENKVMQYVIDFKKDENNAYEYITSNDTILGRKSLSLGSIKKGKSFFYQNDSLYAKYKRMVAARLGFPNYEAADSNRYMSACFETLSSPLSDLIFGDLCGNGQDETKGHIAVSYLLNHHNYAAVRAVMRSYNPEGRMFGVQALLEAAKYQQKPLTPDDMEVIKKVLNLDIKIETCDGCIGRSVKAKDALRIDLLPLVGP